MLEERETAAEDQGYRLNTDRMTRPLFQRPRDYPTSASYENLWDKGLVRLTFRRGMLAGLDYIMDEALAEDHIKHGRAVKSENQRRVRQV